jgi:hypothetical protein
VISFVFFCIEVENTAVLESKALIKVTSIERHGLIALE